MDYDWCRINELVRHAAQGDAKAQALLIEEIRSYLRGLVDQYGAAREPTADFAKQVLARVRRDYGDFWAQDSEFGNWIEGILQREVEEACRRT
jgi:DNA-directed RNA polymerase specialized sigma24 family protein